MTGREVEEGDAAVVDSAGGGTAASGCCGSAKSLVARHYSPTWKIGLFTANLILGLGLSEVFAQYVTGPTREPLKLTIEFVTVFCLAYIMIRVGYEFDVDKRRLLIYELDAVIALMAASLPWTFAAIWFMFVIPVPLDARKAFAIGIFSAPTSAGILFSMLEAAGLHETWLFAKARVLAVLDDLLVILLLIPITTINQVDTGFRWEVGVVIGIIVVLVIVGWRYMHKLTLPFTWRWTLLYAAIVTGLTEGMYYITRDLLPIEAIHVEVLLPAFVIGVVTKMDNHCEEEMADVGDGEPSENTASAPQPKVPEEEGGGEAKKVEDVEAMARALEREEFVATVISASFMIFVGLSMPPIFSGSAPPPESGVRRALASSGSTSAVDVQESTLDTGTLLLHVLGMTVLMVLGKMSVTACYASETDVRSRIALGVGMCPRGEVGAGVIVIAIDLGVAGDAVRIAVLSLAVNLMLSGVFILIVKRLVEAHVQERMSLVGQGLPVPPALAAPEPVFVTRRSSLVLTRLSTRRSSTQLNHHSSISLDKSKIAALRGDKPRTWEGQSGRTLEA